MSNERDFGTAQAVEIDRPPMNEAELDQWAHLAALNLRRLARDLEALGPRYSRTALMARRAVLQAEADGLLRPEPDGGPA